MPKKILFVCTGNTCRSPMAEGIMKDMAAKRGLDVQASSCGTVAFSGERPSENAVACMREWAVDISGHRASLPDKTLLEEADCIYVMSPAHLAVLSAYGEEIAAKTSVLGSGISDPFGGNLSQYRRCRDEIAQVLSQLLDKDLSSDL